VKSYSILRAGTLPRSPEIDSHCAVASFRQSIRKHLQPLSNLKSLNVSATKVTQAGADKVMQGLTQVHEDQSDVVKETVTGGIAFRPQNRQWIRISGTAKVLDAHTLVFEDGTEVDIDGGIEAPELEQRGLIGNALYPCGKEAADFLRKIIGNNRVTCIANPDHVAGNKIWIASAFVGEMNLNIEMIRNGWAISDHSGMDPWEIIAREKKRGLWRGTFVVPAKWRKGERLPGETAENR
jgi:endonuclease YncB( thermonuclease family)